jgi:hypothetical protein
LLLVWGEVANQTVEVGHFEFCEADRVDAIVVGRRDRRENNAGRRCKHNSISYAGSDRVVPAMDEEAFSQQLRIGFAYSFLYDDWVTPLKEALHGLSAADAAWTARPEAKSIWEIVLHLAVWHENIVERVRTREATRPVEGSWPALPAVLDDSAWEAAKGRLWVSIGTIREMLDTTSLEELQAGPYGIADVICRFTHNAYHIGQITKIREFMEVPQSGKSFTSGKGTHGETKEANSA